MSYLKNLQFNPKDHFDLTDHEDLIRLELLTESLLKESNSILEDFSGWIQDPKSTLEFNCHKYEVYRNKI